MLVLKGLCIGGVAVGAAIGARRVVRFICEPHGNAARCDPRVDLPLRDLHKSATLAYLAYQEPKEIRARLAGADLDREFVCIGDLCKVARERPTLPIFFDGQPMTDAQAFLWKGADDDRTVYIAFRGTEDMSDALADLDVRHSYIDGGVKGAKVHNGFLNQYKSIDSSIMLALETLKEDFDKVVVCGHSLGGALATIAAVNIATRMPSKVVRCHTCGSPRVGNREFREWFDMTVSENWRIYNANDSVSMVPISHRFEHVTGGICIDDNGQFRIVSRDVPWFVRPFVHMAYLDVFNPICDHDCKLYISRLNV